MSELNAHNCLAETAKRRRKALSLTQQELGDMVGCGRLFIIDLERGKPTLRLDKVLDVLHVLGLQFRIENGRDVIRDASDESN